MPRWQQRCRHPERRRPAHFGAKSAQSCTLKGLKYRLDGTTVCQQGTKLFPSDEIRVTAPDFGQRRGIGRTCHPPAESHKSGLNGPKRRSEANFPCFKEQLWPDRHGCCPVRNRIDFIDVLHDGVSTRYEYRLCPEIFASPAQIRVREQALINSFSTACQIFQNRNKAVDFRTAQIASIASASQSVDGLYTHWRA